MPAPGDEVVVRPFRPQDRASLDALVAEGVAAHAFAGSADPEGRAFGWFAQQLPDDLAVAVRGEVVVGVVSPNIKAVYVTPAERRRGVGRRLVEAAAALDRARGHDAVFLGVLPDDPDATAFLRATGFAYHSTLWDMRLPVETPMGAAGWPHGLVARPVRLPGDIDAFVDLFNTAFAEHATPLQMNPAMLARAEEDLFDPQDALVVEDPSTPGRLIGFCSTDPGRRPDQEPIAEIWTIGVRPEHQGRGLGRELLRWGVGRLRSVRDLPVTLSVNGRNEGALRLYEREGFVRIGTRDRWARPLPPAETSVPAGAS